jgi:transcriptional regulator with XRE-family HTH domain
MVLAEPASRSRIRRARLIREARDESLGDVQKAVGIKRSTLSRFETCQRTLPYDKLRALSAHYNVTIEQLLEELLVDA